ncbi:helix-turn-helix domain-containing protein [Burkholderia cepacia]|uniref:helix-turn-helix domain-containing protein n=1 Tax=Burkholderia TaxID=32008 RepID=UPI00031B3A61|nr:MULTISPECIES: helix-turn-helix transcriptional regulator [Burkholderia]MCA7992618.1 helix-turn-helix domain-containing protein [Burkholderia cepacia]MCS6424283.1 helix-turn-helix domain-containing protein [Burkholderia thailandensis]MCS6464064.1 helix-turn-helix domain-containing protein [Burkholderia thailandensis]MDV2129302.1 helix-turn-helix transcriptional regulator [Burkholderia pseudomallei]MDV2230881.1 helix-turn-helix transcriptional regulator [Burkholderia pseudomallei]
MTDKPKKAATPRPSGRFIENPMPLPVERALVAAGDDLALARRRRGLSTSSMAERAGISKKTLYRLEQGDPGVSWGAVIRVLNILNLLPELNKALNTTNDALGLALMNKAVPKRIRVRKTNPDSGAL